MLNLLLVWMATGIWHGAGLNFLAWGLYYAVLLMIEKLVLLKMLDKLPRALQHGYALLLIVVGWAVFAGADMTDGGAYFAALFGSAIIGTPSPGHTAAGGLWTAGDLFRLQNYGTLFLLLAAASLPIGKILFNRLPGRVRSGVEGILIATGLILSTAYLVDSTYNPFLYFRF